MLHEIGKRFKQVVTVEDGVLKGGMGSAYWNLWQTMSIIRK